MMDTDPEATSSYCQSGIKFMAKREIKKGDPLGKFISSSLRWIDVEQFCSRFGYLRYIQMTWEIEYEQI
jgi:hypothetical protein